MDGLGIDPTSDAYVEGIPSGVGSELNRCENIILSLYSMITRGSLIAPKNSPWENLASSSAVFIDEFEDFYPEEILLLSMEARPELNCVTIAGDDLQDTQQGDNEGNEEFFAIWKKKEEIFLDKNFRQREHIGLVTSALRDAIEDKQLYFDDDMGIPLFSFDSPSFAVDDIVHLVNSLPNGASAAVILADRESKEIWNARLKEAQPHISREVRISGERNLTSRLPLHLTTAEEAKGLQFNAVMIPELECFSSMEKYLYIAMTRAKDSLYLASATGSNLGVCVEQLLEAGAIYEETSHPRLI